MKSLWIMPLAAALLLPAADPSTGPDLDGSEIVCGCPLAQQLLTTATQRWLVERRTELASPAEVGERVDLSAQSSDSHETFQAMPATQGPSTQCPVETQCPISSTFCPTRVTYCPQAETVCQETHCATVTTRCPTVPTVCEHTVCPVSPTVCPQLATACPYVSTKCPISTTYCPTLATQCPQRTTYCPAEETRCPVIQSLCQCELASPSVDGSSSLASDLSKSVERWPPRHPEWRLSDPTEAIETMFYVGR